MNNISNMQTLTNVVCRAKYCSHLYDDTCAIDEDTEQLSELNNA